MRTARRTVRPFSILVAVIALSAFAGVGFLVGRSNRISPDRVASIQATATAASYLRAESIEYRLAWQRSYHQGWAAGIASATADGTRAGSSAGRTEASAQAAAAHALAAALASTPIRLTRTTKTERCVPVGGGLCEVLGPGVTGNRCPPASVPNPEGGVVCVPSVLLLAARLADTPNVSVFTP